MVSRSTDQGRIRKVQFTPKGLRVSLRETSLDRLALDFCAVLNRRKVRYAVVSGYPAILLGRTRESEDIDILAAPLRLASFAGLHRSLVRKFECLAPGDAPSIFREYLDAGRESTAVRYSRPGAYVPNVEFKFAKTDLHHDSIRHRTAARANGRLLYVGPLETQVAYKVWLGSPKDLEDARWIWKLAGPHLAEEKLRRAARRLGLSQGEVDKALGVQR